MERERERVWFSEVCFNLQIEICYCKQPLSISLSLLLDSKPWKDTTLARKLQTSQGLLEGKKKKYIKTGSKWFLYRLFARSLALWSSTYRVSQLSSLLLPLFDQIKPDLLVRVWSEDKDREEENANFHSSLVFYYFQNLKARQRSNLIQAWKKKETRVSFVHCCQHSSR